MDRHIAIAITLLTLAVIGSTQRSYKDKARIDNFMRTIQHCADLPALSLAIVDLADKTNSYTAAYGNVSPSLNERANIDTRFCLGGGTEAFTAVLLAMLVHENENITWSTPLQNIVGHRLALSEMYRSRNLNLKDVLAQRTGYPNMDIVSVVSPYKPNRLSRNLRYVQPVAGFREEFVPNQVMYSLLEEVLYDLTQEDWEELIKDRILEPLEMNSIMFLGHKNDNNAPNVAQPVVFYKGKRQALRMDSLKGLKLIRQAAGICLSAKDMSEWMRFLMDGKGKNGSTLVDMKVLEETFDGVQSRGHSDDPQISGYRQPDVEVSYAREQNGLGWITGHYRGHRFISQDGSIPGIQTLATILPDKGLGVFTSFTGKGRSQGLAAKTLINQYALDILLKERLWFDDRNVCQIMEKMKMLHVEETMKEHRDVKRVDKYKGERPTDDYVGYYRNYAYGTVHVRSNDTGMFMDYGDAHYEMYPTNMNDTFRLIEMEQLWFTTYSDTTKDLKIIAVFHEISRDPAHRISDVSISGFDKTGDVTFSRNPAPPRYETSPECHCGASVMTSAVSVLFSFLFVFITIFFR